MGLYDGAIGREGFASTAHVAGILGAPVILVVDISASSRTVAAVVHGLASFDPAVRIAGVILNKAGSARHATEVRQALESRGMPVVGVLHRDDGISAPSRHLGLVPAAERADARRVLDRLAAQIADRVDLAEVVRIAGTAADLGPEPWDPGAHWRPGCRTVRGTRKGRRRWWPSPAAGRSPSATRRPMNCWSRPVAGRWCSTRSRRKRCRATRPGSTSAAGSRRCTPAVWPATTRCAPRWPVRSAPASRPSPSVPGCCTCPGRSTASPWSGRSTPRR